MFYCFMFYSAAAGEQSPPSGRISHASLDANAWTTRGYTAKSNNKRHVYSTNYFEQTYPRATVTLAPKHDGVQLGVKVNICANDGHQLTFYVKTHSEGRLDEKSSAPRLVKPEELLVYEFLKRSPFGTDCHFFHRDQKMCILQL